MKIAICFFGITRSLGYTIASIERNVIAPCKQLGETRVYCHFFEQSRIANPRTGEFGELLEEYQLLQPDQIVLEPPEMCLADRDYQHIANFGAPMSADIASLKNLVHQLHSLEHVHSMAEPWRPNLYLFCRPDLKYHDNLETPIKQAIARDTPHTVLPYWQQFRGYNDRFAICLGEQPARAYATRIQLAMNFCKEKQVGLHAESLLRYALGSQGIRLHWMSARASRIRFNGEEVKESFDREFGRKVESLTKFHLKKFLDRWQ